jgi:hypothetical protein
MSYVESVLVYYVGLLERQTTPLNKHGKYRYLCNNRQSRCNSLERITKSYVLVYF